MTVVPASWLLRTVITTTVLAVPDVAYSKAPVSASDGFSIGSDKGIACRAQASDLNSSLPNPFDQSFEIFCPDAASPVARLFAFRGSGLKGYDGPSGSELTNCTPFVQAKADLPSITSVANCSTSGSSVPYRVYKVLKGKTLFVAEGLAGYDTVLQLGLRSLIANRVVEGDLDIPATASTDAAALASSRASALNPARAALEAYSLNHSGDYAEAIEFFHAALQRGGKDDEASRDEYQAALALQHSNLGQFREADTIFKRLQDKPAVHTSTQILRDNLHAAHLINARRYGEALRVLDASRVETGNPTTDALVLDADTAELLNGGSPVENLLTGRAAFNAERRLEMLRSQSLLLRGMASRLSGDYAQARDELAAAQGRLNAFPPSFEWALARLLAQVWTETALLDVVAGNSAGAEANLVRSVAILDKHYPNRPAALAARTRLGAVWNQMGEQAKALAAYREVVSAALNAPSPSGTSPLLLGPYFELFFSSNSEVRPTVAEMFTASQLLARPGLAQTQATFARGLGGGSDAAAALFRSSLTLTRESEKLEVEIRRADGDEGLRQNLRRRLAAVRDQQTTTLAKLSEFPKFRAFSTKPVALSEIQEILQPSEAYWKVIIADEGVYSFFITRDAALFYRVPLNAAYLAATVERIRRSVSLKERGETKIYPFDVGSASSLFAALAGPAKFERLNNIIFEPDGPLFQLPIGLLVADSESPKLYQNQVDRGEREPFDFRQVRWLATLVDLSTSVSPRSFLDVRSTNPSRAAHPYMGFGQNASPQPNSAISQRANTDTSCVWPLVAWQYPISARELQSARATLGVPNAPLIIGEAFTDQALLERKDMDQYRILHFASHGLTGAPSDGCPSEPAILTSFGQSNSDGLLSFREIFDLKLDADLVILSACDTATAATSETTRLAGVRRGGDSPLDGLVRSFVAAGARAVLATHWAVPDDYDATETLITKIFEEGMGRTIAGALRASQLRVLNRQETSHPFYWAAFALIGDGSRLLQSVSPRMVSK